MADRGRGRPRRPLARDAGAAIQRAARKLLDQQTAQGFWCADLTADTISAQLRALGVPSVNVKWDGQVLKGANATDVKAATTRRDINTE